MLLEPLVSTIEMLQERIQAHGSTLRENETRTRVVLVDPLLQALGWSTADPGLVTLEYDVNGKRADYALLGGGGAPVVFLEAKRLDESLSNHRSQVVAYASELGIKYPALTNGDRWEVYDNSKFVPIEQRNILNLSIVASPAYQTALQLLLLWRPNMATGQPTAASDPVLAAATPLAQAETTPETMSEPASEPDSMLVQTASREVTNAPSVRVEPGWIPISQVNRPKKGDSPPSAIRLNRGPSSEVNGWNPALFATAEWLCSQGKLTIQECPIKITRGTRHIVAVSQEHSNGVEFHFPRQTSTGLYVELHWDPKDVPRHIRFLLETLNVPVDAVELRFD